MKKPIHTTPLRLSVVLGLLFMKATIVAQVVSTFAGSGTAGNIDATSTAAAFNHPSGVALDGTGNLYVADRQNHSIRKITSGGAVSTLAGSGMSGNTDGTGTAASFAHPIAVAVDGSGNVYVADFFGHKIRKVTPGGAVSTLAGSGFSGSTDATGTAASFAYPVGVAVDGSGNVYVADRDNNKIRKVTATGIVSTVVGSADGINIPSGITIDGSGNLYVTNLGDHKILKITPSLVVTVLAGSGSSGSADGTGTAASFNEPKGIAVDGLGNVYVADYSNHKIRKITPAGVVSTLAGSGNSGSDDGAAANATFFFPYGVATNGTSVYVGGYINHKIRKISPSTPQTISGLSDINKTTGDASFNLSATASSGLTVSYTSSNTSVATISGNMVTIVGAGTTTITASQAGDVTYMPANDVTATLTVQVVSSANEESEIENTRVYSNSYGQIIVEGETEQIVIMDLNGKIVYNGNSKLINVNTGIYIVQIQRGKYKKVHKVAVL